MAYQIHYANLGRRKFLKKKSIKNFTALSLIIFLVLGGILLKIYALPIVKEVLIPGDADVTAAAFSTMIEDLQQGIPLSDAFTAFCQEIVSHGTQDS